MEGIKSHIKGSESRFYSSKCCNSGFDLANIVGGDEIGNTVRARCLECGEICKVVWKKAGEVYPPYSGMALEKEVTLQEQIRSLDRRIENLDENYADLALTLGNLSKILKDYSDGEDV